MIVCDDCDAELENEDTGRSEHISQAGARYRCPDCGARFELDATSTLLPID